MFLCQYRHHVGTDLVGDVTIELEDPSVVFYGDLLWNRMFPNYRDTMPTAFADRAKSSSWASSGLGFGSRT